MSRTLQFRVWSSKCAWIPRACSGPELHVAFPFPKVQQDDVGHWWPASCCTEGASVSKTKNIFRTCVCPSTLSLCRGWRRIVSRRHALAAVSSVLCGRGEEWIASRRRIRVGREGDVQWLLRLRGWRWISGEGLGGRLVVRIMDHMAVWWSLEWRWSRLTGIHGVRVSAGASEKPRERKADVGDRAGSSNVESWDVNVRRSETCSQPNARQR
jgi:hypothetical protein